MSATFFSGQVIGCPKMSRRTFLTRRRSHHLNSKVTSNINFFVNTLRGEERGGEFVISARLRFLAGVDNWFLALRSSSM